jgi:hypothetical protein
MQAFEGRGFVHSKRDLLANSVVRFLRRAYDQREPFPSLGTLDVIDWVKTSKRRE